MKIFFAFLLVILIVFSGYHLSFRKFRVPLFARKFHLTGMEFLFLGLLLGPQFLNILDEKTCSGLAPLSALVLGWIGMLFGFQFELSKLKRFPLYFFSAAITESVLTLTVVFAGVYLTLPLIVETADDIRTMISVALAGAAACTAQTGLSLVTLRKTDRHQTTVKLLRYLSSIDGLVAMLVLLPVFIYFPHSVSASPQTFLIGNDIMTAAMAFIGLIVLYNLFLSQRRDQSELAMITIGMTVFVSGFASVMNFSPLLANFFVGACMVNVTREKEKIFNTLVSIEKPAYLLLLMFLGSSWQFDGLWMLLFAAGYCFIRFLGKFLGGAAVSFLSSEITTYPRTLGLGLIEQGGLALAILYDFQQGFQSELIGIVVGIILLAIVYNDLLSPALLERLLKKDL